MASKTFSQLITDISTGLVSNESRFTDLDVGSRIYALITGVSGAIANGWIGLDEAKQIFYASTATGADLDRRVEDLGMLRNPGSKSTGAILGFTTGPVTIPIGTLLVNADGVTVLEVVQTTNLVAPYTPIPVIATEVGSIHNLSAGTLVQEIDGKFSTVVFRVGSQGVNGAGNPIGKLTGGANRETDEKLRIRFAAFIKNLSRATMPAVTQALKGISGVTYLVIENHKPVPGYVTISISDGSSSISEDLEADVAEVMQEWSAAGIGYILKTIERTDIHVTVTAYTKDLTISPAAIQSQISTLISGMNEDLTLGHSLYKSEIIKAGFIDGLENFTVNSPVSDVLADPGELLNIDSVVVNVVYV